ncbi:hypothetical protein WA158_008543 [Blastocystis sp. Blastoise]
MDAIKLEGNTLIFPKSSDYSSCSMESEYSNNIKIEILNSDQVSSEIQNELQLNPVIISNMAIIGNNGHCLYYQRDGEENIPLSSYESFSETIQPPSSIDCITPIKSIYPYTNVTPTNVREDVTHFFESRDDYSINEDQSFTSQSFMQLPEELEEDFNTIQKNMLYAFSYLQKTSKALLKENIQLKQKYCQSQH